MMNDMMKYLVLSSSVISSFTEYAFIKKSNRVLLWSKGERNKLQLNNVQIDRIMEIFSKLESASKDCSDASNLLKLTYLLELLIFINEAFTNTELHESNQLISKKLVPLLEYIGSNLNDNLSLQSLEEKFFINRYYLSSLFKKDTGVNIHEYIILKRISKAKVLLSEGYSITEVCQMSGFNDYSHFIRAFKLHVGISPGQYKKRHAFVEKKNLFSS
jgi:AraC-like DNA-binding protein